MGIGIFKKAYFKAVLTRLFVYYAWFYFINNYFLRKDYFTNRKIISFFNDSFLLDLDIEEGINYNNSLYSLIVLDEYLVQLFGLFEGK